MQFKQLEETTGERRYDEETLRQVTALAQQLQESHRETLTASQIEGIGEEVGLGRAFVREALKQLALNQSQALTRHDRAKEFRGLVAGWGICALSSLLAWLLGVTGSGAASLFMLLAPLLFFTIGFLMGKRRAAMGARGGGVSPSAVSSPALLDLLVTVQRQLEERAQHRAFLSIEVAGAGEIRRDAPEALVAHSFGQFVDWVEGLVRQCGGQCRGTVDDGLTCIFPADSGAVSVARQLQEGLGRFNTERNRLAAPLRIRCGIAAGGVVDYAERPPDALQSAIIERAVELQRQAEPGDILVSGELAAAALLELRSLAPLGREAGAAPVFSWRAGQRAHQRP